MLSILIPIWNQGKIVKENFAHLADVLYKTGEDYEVIFIDDGSTDDTARVLEDIKGRYGHITILTLPHLGQHPALYEGFKIAQGDVVITMDADQKVDPKYIPQLLDKLNEGNDIAVAWRVSRPGIGSFRRLCSLLINLHTNWATGKRLHDHACCLKAYKGEVIKETIGYPELKKFFSLWVARYAKRVAEVKVDCRYKSAKSSSLGLAGSFKLFFDIIRSAAKFHPRGGTTGGEHPRGGTFRALIFFTFFLSCLWPHSSTSEVELSGEKKLNVILIVVDALRADHLGCYGYERDTSPVMDQLAEEGVLFNQAITQGSLTRISVASLFTSLYPSVHRVYELDAPLADEFITLPEILKKHGWATAVFAGLTLTSFSNFIDRFDESYVDTAGAALHEQPEWKNKYKVTPEITDHALEYLKKPRKRPFFLYIHYYDVHPPYVLPKPYNKIFWKEKIGKELEDFVVTSFRKDRWPHQDFACEVDSVPFRYILSQYDGSIRYVDDHIKMILGQLKRSGLSNNTLVIVTSDHGESFMEHGYFFHGDTLYDEVLRVPLIMRLDKRLEKKNTVNQLVRLIDVMPTILDILGIKENVFTQGQSLLPLIDGKEAPRKTSFSEAYFYSNGKGLIKGLRTDDRKFIETQYFKTNDHVYELYDLKNDPKEANDLINEMPREAEGYKKQLMDYTQECEKIRESILGPGHVEKPVIMDEETKERMRSLGYLQ